MENNSELTLIDQDNINPINYDWNDINSDISTSNDSLQISASHRKWNKSKKNGNINMHDNFNDEKEDVEKSIHTSKQVLKLMEESGFEMTQINGQRKLGPPPNWIGLQPKPDCEVFVGNIPRNLYEDEIYPIFRRVGEIYEIRLMMDFSGTNRGYCFVMYVNKEYADYAIKKLNNYEIRPGRRIGVVPSINNCRLCIGELPQNLDTEIFIRKICETTSDLDKIAVYRDLNGRTVNALISYKTHIAAAMGRRGLVPARTNLFPGVDLTVDWAHPKQNFHNVIEESGIVDETGKVEITRRCVGPNKKLWRATNREEFLNDSITSYIEDDFVGKIYRNKFDNTMSQEFYNTSKNNFVARNKLQRSNNYQCKFDTKSECSSSECDIQIYNHTDRLIIAPLEKKENLNRRENFNSKLRDINQNARIYKSSMELSKTNSNKYQHNQFMNKSSYQRHNKENMENIPFNYYNVQKKHHKFIPMISQQQLLCTNSYVNSDNVTNGNFQLLDGSECIGENSVENFVPYFNRCLNLNSVPLTHDVNTNGFNSMQNYKSPSPINYVNNSLIMTQPNNLPFQFAFPREQCHIYHDDSIAQQNIENFNPDNIHYDLQKFVDHNQSHTIDHNYCMRYNNNYSNKQDELPILPISVNCTNICDNGALNNQELMMTNRMPSYLPKYNTKSFGLGRMKYNSGLTIRDVSECHEFPKLPRPILNRSAFRDV